VAVAIGASPLGLPRGGVRELTQPSVSRFFTKLKAGDSGRLERVQMVVCENSLIRGLDDSRSATTLVFTSTPSHLPLATKR